MTDIKLRPYQRDFIDAVRNQFIHNHKKVVGVAPCGAGKTIMTGWMIKESLNRGKRSIFFVHRRELIEQTSKTFTALDIPHGIIAADLPSNLNLPVQIASVQTLARRLNSIPAPDFLICDECHHILANTYKKILDAYPNAFLLGVTATPQRMGGITLCDVFNSMVLAPSVNKLISLGNLTPFKYFAAPLDLNLKNVRTKNGDFDSNDLFKVMDNKEITGDIVRHYLSFADGKAAICYCVNVRHSKTVANAFQLAGISAAHCDGETPKKERAAIVDAFRRGDINVLCNAELFGEGFDVPHCQAVILARPTKSLTLFIQQSMRSMRPDPDDPNKVAIIIDCVQNRERHGLPNFFHEWSLDPNIKKPKPCPICKKLIVPTRFTKKEETPFSFQFNKGNFFLINSFDKDGEPVKLSVDYFFDNQTPSRVFLDPRNGRLRRICPECGYLFPLLATPFSSTAHPTFRDGYIEEIDVSFSDQDTNPKTVIHRDTSPEFFLEIAKKKDYQIGWVAFNSLPFAKSYDDCLHIANVCGYKKGWAFHKWQELAEKLAKKNDLQKVPLAC